MVVGFTESLTVLQMRWSITVQGEGLFFTGRLTGIPTNQARAWKNFK
jgi:hypothetical protein